MKLERKYSIDLPIDLVWDSILNPDLLVEILPGCKSLNALSNNHYKAEIEIKVGPVKGAFSSELMISDIRPLAGYHFEVSGVGTKGHMSGNGDITLTEKDGLTVLSFSAEGNVGGILARVGQRLIEAAGKKLMDQGFANFQEKMAEGAYA